ncbi:Asp-tRNA(Asn)/Glu-tRNA(Gln) amidotransferase GatCAB subunit C [Paroceanicella profunda]|uniref:Asp-tRNA(Asn)/Glu-tRNA(Gln) amidotransferase GatCAB subunit C n=1 Tax=Paroceanicella profunda TaxID=2579971 RepID=A0A5B8G1H8_9RHOB|nr:molybdopterin guanine dinucleotide-containing S/N-oxide reductase [Paroceanicella profunda]QDL92343.1 Asp-tRNA(Asn)/Glu-tRNA(Gln) amidotransferase GatCAB subunit C [Paroceanicella profunda]
MTRYTSSHWGLYEVEGTEDAPRIVPFRGDPDPSEIGLHQLAPELKAARIRRPAVRRSWLEGGPGHAPELRGREPFVEVSWEEASRLAAAEVARIRESHGNKAIFGGSYGWSSAGRFHHAQSQVHRFLNIAGGYVRSRDSYSLAAAHVILPHVVDDMHSLMTYHTSWDVLAENCTLFVAFGGVPAKNSQISAGGVARHKTRAGLRALGEAGAEVVNISPVSDNLITDGPVRWVQIRPGSDTAMMLGLAHVLQSEGLHDTGFLASHCTGWERFEAYLTGESDGTPKTADWAAELCGVPADEIRALARRMASSRTMINVAWALQRSDRGEQPFWMTITLAAMLGQIGLPGGGFAVGYGAENMVGSNELDLRVPSLPQGQNAVAEFIPVARIADMLLNPGGSFTYNGGTYTYPDIRLVWWAGGNPFHHHQDLTRLQRAFEKPETIVVNEQFWTAAARRADIVLPATTAMERDDLGFGTLEGHYAYMKAIVPPVGEARDDYEIFRGIARELGLEEAFTEGREAEDWLRHFHDRTRQSWAEHGIEVPDYETFREQGLVDLGPKARARVMLKDFRENPAAHPLPTPSGRIEIYSERVASFGLADCKGHPSWFPPEEWLGAAAAARFPLHLVSDQPERRLHSQLDPSPWSRANKIGGREPVLMHPEDAAARGLSDGDTVELFNDRGRCLAGLRVTETVMRGVARLSTGGWYDPDPDSGTERHGNPNALTADRPASGLSQGCAAHSCLIDIRPATLTPEPRPFVLPEGATGG